MKLRKMLQNNQGFSIIEFMVIIALTSVLIGVTTISLSVRPDAVAKAAADDLDALLTRCRNASLTKAGDTKIELVLKDGQVYAIYTEASGKVGEQKLTMSGVSLKYTAGGTEQNITSSPLTIEYDSRSGGFKSDVTEITIKGSSTARTIKLGQHTGTHYVES